MKYIIVIDEKDFKDHIEEVIITHNNEEEWKDMIDVEYIKKHMMPMLSRKYLSEDNKTEIEESMDIGYILGWNTCVDEILGEE